VCRAVLDGCDRGGAAVTEDTARAIAAMKLIFDGRDPVSDLGAIMVTLEHVVGGTLLALMSRDHRRAVGMLNEGLVPGVETRLALAASKGRT
jgi:hypothetical protein